MGILVKGGTVIDGTGSPPVPGGAVLIDGTKIVRVGPERQVTAGASDRVVDAEGGTIIPGMINLHDHIHRRMIRFPRVGSSYREHSDRLEKDPDSFVVLLAAYCQLIQLRTGVTTVRDIGCRSHFTIDLRRAIDEGKIPGPRLSVAGKFISMTGGHGANGREADGPDEVRKAAREQLGAGADFLKLMATGGILNFPDEDPGAIEYSEEEMRAAVEEAHKQGRKVAAHAHAAAGIKNALRAGVDCIEHGSFIDDEAIELFLKLNATLDPTLSGIFRYADYERVAGNTEFAERVMERAIKPGRANIKRAIQAGVKIGTGTDSAGIIAEEIELLSELGMSPMQCLMAATRVSAETMGLEKEIGTLEPGKLADLVILKSDPLKDVKAFYDPKLVIKDGVIFEGLRAV